MDKLNIKIDKKALNFILYLISIKQFDALSIWRVLHKPEQNEALYNQYLKLEENKNVLHKK